jgi:DNA repair protein RadC
MSVSREEIERRRRLAEETAQEVDPSEIEGLAPPPTSPPKSQKLETQQAPDRVNIRRSETVPFVPGETQNIRLRPPPAPIDFDAIEQQSRDRASPDRAAMFDELERQSRGAAADATAGRLETAASEFGEAAVGMATSATEGVIRGVIAERQGRGIANRLGIQPLANKLLGRELTDDELTRIMPEIENNPVTKWLDKNLDFNLGSNPEYLSNPDEDFEVGKFLNSTVPAALGSMSAFVLAGLVTKGATAAAGAGPLASSIAGGVTASGLGAVTGGAGTAEGVAAKGGTNEQIIDAFVRGNLPGLTEGFPISRALNRLDKGSGGQLSRILKEGFKGSVEEAIQETVQGASTKAIENALLDLDQSLFDRETKEGTAAGAVAGFLTSALMTALGGRRRGNRRDGPASRAEAEASGQPPPEAPEGPPTPEAAPTQPPPETDIERDIDADTMFGVPDEDLQATPEGDVPEQAPSTAIPETYEGPDGRIYPVGTQLEGESDEAFAARLEYEAGLETAPEPAPAPEAAPEAVTPPEPAPEAVAPPVQPEAAPEPVPAPETQPEAVGPEPDRRQAERPDTATTALQTARGQLARGVDSTPDTGQSIIDIPPLPGRDKYSDNEQDHQDALAAFLPEAEQAGWQLAGQSENGNNFGYVTPEGDRVEVYKKGAGMGWAIQVRPPEADWKKATKVTPPNVDPALAQTAPPQAQPEAAPEPAPAAPEPMPLPEGVPEPEPATGELPSGASPVTPTGTTDGRNTVQTAAGEQVETQFAVMPSDFLKTSSDEGFTQALQPRERGDRQASQQQIQNIVQNFNPRFLGVDASASSGAPIVNDRGEVISGNGRVTALREIFANNPEQAEAYRAYVSDQLGVDLQPGEILVQTVAQPMDATQQRAFVDQANVSQTAGFSRAEQARTDARAIDDAVLSSLQPTDVTNVGNQDFVRAFVGALQSRGEDMSGLIQSNGQLSAEGRQRVEAALLARAIGATDEQSDSLRRTLEDPDDNTRNITGAVLDAAKELAGLQIAAEQGAADPAIAGQVAPALAQAIETMSQLRSTGQSVPEFLAQMDLEGPRPALVDEFIQSFMNPQLTRPTSRNNMAQIFRRFGEDLSRAANTLQGDMLGATPQAADPAAILRAAREAVQGAQAAPTQSGLFGPGGNPFGGGTAPQSAPQGSLPPTPAGGAGGQAAATTPQPSPASAPGTTQVKKTANFDTEGTYDVTLPNGLQVQIFRDTQQFGSPVWHLVDDANVLGLSDSMRQLIDTQGIGSTQREAIGFIEQAPNAGGANAQQQSQQSSANTAGMAAPSQQSGQGSNSASSAINAGNIAPGTGIPTESNNQQPEYDPDSDQSEGLVSGQTIPNQPEPQQASPEKTPAPGTVNPGPQTNVANQKKESYEQRGPQFDEKAAILGNDKLEELEKASEHNRGLPENHPNVSTYAMQINKDFVQNRSTQFIGVKIETAKDFATLAQAYRDPQFETLRYVFLDVNRKVIFQTAVSARLPASAPAVPAGTNGWLKNLFAKMQESGANYVYLTHNHPSGKADPSPADIKMTKSVDKLAKRHGMGLKHIVVNSNQYAVINSNGSYNVETAQFFEGDDPLLTPQRGMEHDLLGVDMGSNPNTWAAAVKALSNPNNVALMGMSPRNEVRALGEMSWDKFISLPPKKLQQELQNWKVNSGSARLVIGGIPLDTVIFPDEVPLGGKYDYMTSQQIKKLSPMGDKLHRTLTRSGIVYDFVDTGGNSALYLRQFKRPPRSIKGGEKAGINEGMQFYEDDAPVEQIDSEAVRRQRETVQNVRAGQPLDRLMRWMFTGMGVFEDRWLKTNTAGEDPSFRVGEAALNKLTYWLNDTWFPVQTDQADQESEDGRQPYAPGRIRNAAYVYGNRILKRARHGLIDRFGLPDGVRELDEKRFRERLQMIEQGVENVKKLIEMGVDSIAEAKILQGFLTGEIQSEQIADKEWAELAEEVRASVDHLGMEAVNLGWLSRETYEANKGTWLHRSYYKYETNLEAEGGSVTKWIGETLRGAGRGVRGDAFKGRGIYNEITQQRLLKDVPKDLADKLGWGQPKSKTTGKVDPILLGQRFKIYDVLVDENATQGIEGIPAADTPTRIKRRIYWPADEPVPATFGNYELRGDFVVRNIQGKKLSLWRDYTKAEREQMGEIMDARYNIIKTFQLMSRDLANGKFFRAISQNPEWTWDESIHGPIPDDLVAPEVGGKKGLTGASKLSSYIDYEWVQVPDTPVPGTKANVKKWGDLAGRYVRMEVWKDIAEIGEMNRGGTWNAILTEWKLNKTARNPVVHMNNVMSNLLLMDLLDIRTRDLIEGSMMRLAPLVLQNQNLSHLHGMFRRYHNPELLSEIRANGGFGHSLVDIELTGEVLNPIAKELTEVMGNFQRSGGRDGFMNTARFLNVVAKVWTAQTDMYRIEDEVFRTATVIRKLQQGYPMAEAARMAREQFLNYDIRAPWINAGRRSVMPFISYTYRAVPAITEAIMRRPWKLAKYILVAEVANAMAYAVSGGDEEYERGSLREEVQGNISFGVFPGGVPRMLRLPSNDEFGRPQFLDIRRWIPAGDVFDLHNASPIPIPTWMHFSGPLMIAGEMALNRSAFTGQDIVDPLADDAGDKFVKYINFGFQSLAPSAPWIPNSWYWNRISEAGVRTDPVGRTNSRGQAVLQSIGIKASSQDPELGYVYKAREFEATARALKAQLNKAARDYQRNIINEAGWREAQEAFRHKMGTLERLRTETFAPYVEQQGNEPPTEFEQ